MNDNLQFYTSVGTIDVWFEQDTKSGKTDYMFWYFGRTYHADNPVQIIRMANKFMENCKQKVK